MRAIVIQQFGGPEQLTMRELPDPAPLPGHVVIEVRAFGLNHAEIYFRRGLWGDVARVSGIECVGVVRADPDGTYASGETVAALMGGMGRTIDGSYAELTRVPAANVVPIDSTLPWEELATIPESYATAWTCLDRNLALRAGHTVLIRGATSALGQAAVNIASHTGAQVVATTRNPERLAGLMTLGAHEAVLDAPDLSRHIRARHPTGIDAVLDIVGTSTILDSLAAARPDGRVCLAGFLGGGAPLPAFDPMMQLPSGVHLSFFASAFTFGTADYPLSRVPMQAMVDRAAAGIYKAKPARIFGFEEIREAHRLMESNLANGKIVVRL
jgi:NADPH2:quinone reductase